MASTRGAKLPATDGDAETKAWLAGVFDRAAATYDKVAGAYHEHFGARLVDLAEVGPDDAVLDVACGRGAVVVPAAAQVGSSGRVVGVDLSPEMVRLACERVGAVPNVEVLVMDAEHLDVPDGSFTHVLCGFGVFFLPDPERAVAGFRRTLAPGGRIGLSTWGTEDERWGWEDELLAGVEVERRAVRRPFDEPDELAALLTGAGFDDVTVRTERHEVELADAEEWWAWKWSYSLRGVLEQLPADRLRRWRDEASARIAAMRADGPLGLRLEALVGLGRSVMP